MQIEITGEKENPLLKRKEVQFRINHGETGSTPPRLEVRKAVASELKIGTELVFIKRFITKTGTQSAFGVAHIYQSVEGAETVEPEYIVKRNVPPEKPKEEKKE